MDPSTIDDKDFKECSVCADPRMRCRLVRLECGHVNHFDCLYKTIGFRYPTKCFQCMRTVRSDYQLKMIFFVKGQNKKKTGKKRQMEEGIKQLT